MKKNISIFSCILVTTSCVLFAATDTQSVSVKAGPKTFCTEVKKTFSILTAPRILVIENKSLMKKRADRNSVLIGNLAARRVETTTQRTNLLNELSKRAQTEDERAALATFIKKLNSASATKDAAIDALISKNETEAAQLVSHRAVEIEKATAMFNDAIAQAESKAEAECLNQVSPILVRTHAKDALADARTKLKDSLKSIEKSKVISDVTKQTRKNEINNILRTYNESIKSAKEDLKAAFKRQASRATSDVLAIAQTKDIGGIKITFNSMVQDNRCPVDVTCIEAGAVTVNVTLSDGTHTETRNFPSDEVPYVFYGSKISIAEVKPEAVSTKTIPTSKYHITFRVTK